MTTIKRPNFFIIGAPKSGTTSLFYYLKQHPEVFMPDVKEPFYFSKDLWCDPLTIPHRNEEEYLALFQSAKDEKCIGEGSVSYLYSKVAPLAIQDFCDQPKFIVMLRNPVDMIYSLHGQTLDSCNENIFDFEKALDLEEERKKGKKIPKNSHFPTTLLYRECNRYSKYIRYWMSYFDFKNFCFIIFDDFISNPKKIYAEVLSFLNVDPTFKASFEVYNQGQTREFTDFYLNVFFKTHPNLVRLLNSRILGYQGTKIIKKILQPIFPAPSKRPPMSLELRQKIKEEYVDEILILSNLIQRDLSMWT